MNGFISNSLSLDTKEVLEGKRGEDIANADDESQDYEASIAETNIEVKIK